MPTIRARKRTHILHHTQDRHINLLEHLNAARGIPQRKVLRRRDDDGTRELDALRDGELDIARAWWQVENQEI